MAYNDDLLPAKNDNDIDGNGDGNGDGKPTADDNRDPKSSVVGSIPVVGSASGSDTAGNGSRADERTHIDAGKPAGDDNGRTKLDPSRARIDGNRRGNSGRKRGDSRSGSGSNSASSASGSAETEAKPSAQAVPRPVKIGELKSGAKTSAADVAITDKFVTEIWGILFQGASVLLRDPEWKIDEDDAGDLATRTIALLKTLDTKNAAKLEKKIAKYAPSLSLLMALTALVGPRIAHTRSLKRGNLPKENSASGSGTAAPTSSATSAGAPMASKPSDNGNGQQTEFAITPLRRHHWGEVLGRDDA